MIMWYLTHARRHPSSEATWAAWLILVGGGGVEVEVEVAERGGEEGAVFRLPNYLWHERARPLKIQLLELRTSWSSRFFMLSFVVESDTPTTVALPLIKTH